MKEKPLKKLLEKAVLHLKNRCSGNLFKPDLKSGFYKIDTCLQKGHLVILAGIPRIGRTSLALDITRNLALNENKAIGYISMGESEEDIIQRLLSSVSKVDLWKIRTGCVNHDDNMATVEEASKILSSADIFISDIASPSSDEIIAIVRKLNRKKKLDLLIIDYLQLITEKTPVTTEKVIEKFKKLAVELNIPVILLVNAREDILKEGYGVLRALRIVGNLEKISDAIIYLRRENDDQSGELFEILIEHNSNGFRGMMRVNFNGLLLTFRDIWLYQTSNIFNDTSR